MGPAIAAVGLSKRYAGSSPALRWVDAVRDASFEVNRGESVGLIGRNGAGKSTLLRMLSRVTRPSSGYADVAGRVGAMLEVGTGFHPELTGRENTYLSGALLGLSRRDISSRYDEIVAFSEIEPFMETPVKRYSSGMYARLGFAVAAHLLPDILIVDEVLAVGDLPFQAKCLARMHRLTDDGTTVLFVSHNLLAVADLCSRGLVMADGEIVFDGPSDNAIQTYRRTLGATRQGDDVEVRSVAVTIDGGTSAEPIEVDAVRPLRVEARVDRDQGAAALPVILNVLIERSDGVRAVHLRSDMSGVDLVLRPGTTILRAVMDDLRLAPGSYALWVRVVGLDPRAPLILDSRRIELQVSGDQRLDGVLAPPHRFEQLRLEAGREKIAASR